MGMTYGEVLDVMEYTLRYWGVPNTLGKASSELMLFCEVLLYQVLVHHIFLVLVHVH